MELKNNRISAETELLGRGRVSTNETNYIVFYLLLQVKGLKCCLKRCQRSLVQLPI